MTEPIDGDPDDEFADAYDDDWESEELDCPACGAAIYEDAVSCPVCGEYVTPGAGQGPWAGRSPWWILLGLLGVIATIVALLR